MKTSVFQTVRAYIDPTYLAPPSQGIVYRWCALTNMTGKAAEIQNKIVRYIVQFFACAFDALIGCGLLGSMFYNAGAFTYNVFYVKTKNFFIQEECPKWNKTALKTWAIIATFLLGYGLYRLGTIGATKQANIPSSDACFAENNSPSHGTLAYILGLGSLVGAGLLTRYLLKKSSHGLRETIYGEDRFPNLLKKSSHGLRETTYGEDRFPIKALILARSKEEFLKILAENGAENFSVAFSLSKNMAIDNDILALQRKIEEYFPEKNCQLTRPFGKNKFFLNYSTYSATTSSPTDPATREMLEQFRKQAENIPKKKIHDSEMDSQEPDNLSKFQLEEEPKEKFQILDLSSPHRISKIEAENRPLLFPISRLIQATSKEQFLLILQDISKNSNSVTYSLPNAHSQKQAAFEIKLKQYLGEENFRIREMPSAMILSAQLNAAHALTLEYTPPVA